MINILNSTYIFLIFFLISQTGCAKPQVVQSDDDNNNEELRAILESYRAASADATPAPVPPPELPPTNDYQRCRPADMGATKASCLMYERDKVPVLSDVNEFKNEFRTFCDTFYEDFKNSGGGLNWMDVTGTLLSKFDFSCNPTTSGISGSDLRRYDNIQASVVVNNSLGVTPTYKASDQEIYPDDIMRRNQRQNQNPTSSDTSSTSTTNNNLPNASKKLCQGRTQRVTQSVGRILESLGSQLNLREITAIQEHNILAQRKQDFYAAKCFPALKEYLIDDFVQAIKEDCALLVTLPACT